MSTRFQRLVVLYRNAGLGALLAELLRLVVAAIYVKRTELLLLKRLDRRLADRPRPGELRIEPITMRHAALLWRFNEQHRTQTKVIASLCYLRHGYEGFLAFVDDEPIGYWWWVSNAIDPAITHPCVGRFRLGLKDDELFAFDYFIADAYRRHGMAVKFLSAIYTELARRGYRGVWGSVDSDNVAARWVYKVLGNTVVGRTISHELFSAFLFQGRRVFVRNTRWSPTHSFEHSLLFTFESRSGERSGTDPLARGLSADHARRAA